MKYYIIYKITNRINNMIYIGMHQTKNLDDGYMGSSKTLTEDINKFGIENFKKEILYTFGSRDEMKQKEKDIVDRSFVLREDTYNQTTGGNDGFYYINKNNLNNKSGQCYIVAEKIKQDSEFKKWFGKQISKSLEEYYKNNPGTFTDKKHTEESKRKIGEANKIYQKGVNNSQYGTCWIHNKKLKENKKIYKGDSIPSGWEIGRKMKFD